MEAPRTRRRLAEAIILFGLAPLIMLWDFFPRPWFGYLYLLMLPAYFWLRWVPGFSIRWFWYGRSVGEERSALKRLFVRFLLLFPLLALVAWLVSPDDLFRLPRERTSLWLAIVILYPVFAVYPQEFLYRLFFFKRYEGVARPELALALLNGLLFGVAHVLYGSLLSVVLSAAGGFLFARTYQRTGSMRLVVLEHALYGVSVFTVGLQDHFYSGWAG